MRAEITRNLCGVETKLAMPIGALEKVAVINPRLMLLWHSFVETHSWQYGEIEAIINAGLEAGGSTLRFKHVYDRHGLGFCAVLAADLLAVAFEHDPLEGDKPGEPPADQTSS